MKIKDLVDMHILDTLKACNDNKTDAAKVLGVTTKTLYNKLSSIPGVDAKEAVEGNKSVPIANYRRDFFIKGLYLLPVSNKRLTLGEKLIKFNFSDKSEESFNTIFPETPIKNTKGSLLLGDIVRSGGSIDLIIRDNDGPFIHSFISNRSHSIKDKDSYVYVNEGLEIDSFTEMAKEMKVSEGTIRNWVKYSKVSRVFDNSTRQS